MYKYQENRAKYVLDSLEKQYTHTSSKINTKNYDRLIKSAILQLKQKKLAYVFTQQQVKDIFKYFINEHITFQKTICGYVIFLN